MQLKFLIPGFQTGSDILTYLGILNTTGAANRGLSNIQSIVWFWFQNKNSHPGTTAMLQSLFLHLTLSINRYHFSIFRKRNYDSEKLMYLPNITEFTEGRVSIQILPRSMFFLMFFFLSYFNLSLLFTQPTGIFMLM